MPEVGREFAGGGGGYDTCFDPVLLTALVFTMVAF